MARRKHTSDPRVSGGSAIDARTARGPQARHSVVYDARNAVLVEEINTSVAHTTHGGEPAPDAVALVVRGRINRPPDHAPSAEAPKESVEHLHLMSWEAAADLVVDIQSLAARDGYDLRPLLENKWAEREAAGLTRRAPK